MLDLEKGLVVRSVAGHDQDRFYVVLESGEDYVLIADGKLRRLEKPKRKNRRHVRPTKTVLDSAAITSDKKLRSLLAPFNGLAAGENQKEGS